MKNKTDRPTSITRATANSCRAIGTSSINLHPLLLPPQERMNGATWAVGQSDQIDLLADFGHPTKTNIVRSCWVSSLHWKNTVLVSHCNAALSNKFMIFLWCFFRLLRNIFETILRAKVGYLVLGFNLNFFPGEIDSFWSSLFFWYTLPE